MLVECLTRQKNVSSMSYSRLDCLDVSSIFLELQKAPSSEHRENWSVEEELSKNTKKSSKQLQRKSSPMHTTFLFLFTLIFPILSTLQLLSGSLLVKKTIVEN